MRLAQLARKLSIKPSEIIDLLAPDQFSFDDGLNAKLNDDLVRRVVLHFAPERMSEIMLVQTSESEAVEQESVSTPMPLPEVKTEPVVEAVSPAPIADLAETIRAQKVELAGLKVVGKIELPQPRAKEVNNSEAGAVNEPRPKRERKEKHPRREREEKPWRNPIALQREAEAQELEERKRESLKQQKERKRLHYLNQVKNNKPPKAVRIYDEAAPVKAVVVEQKPRTWIGKFLRWLNT